MCIFSPGPMSGYKPNKFISRCAVAQRIFGGRDKSVMMHIVKMPRKVILNTNINLNQTVSSFRVPLKRKRERESNSIMQPCCAQD